VPEESYTEVIVPGRDYPSLDEQIRSNRRKTKFLFAIFALIYGVPAGLIVAAANGWPAGDSPWPLLISVLAPVLLLWFFIAKAEREILRLSRAKRIHQRAECPRLYDAVEVMSIAGGIPPVALYLIDDPQPNAFAFGRSIEKTVIGATTGLLDLLDKDELESVCAHEVAHIRNGDTRLMTYASAVVSLITMIAVIVSVILMIAGAAMGSASSSSNSQRNSNAGMSGGMAGAMIGIAVMWAFVIVTNLVRLAISRNREYLADATAVTLTRYPGAMVSALTRLLEHQGQMAVGATSGHGFLRGLTEDLGLSASASIEHLYAVQLIPRRGWFQNLFSTHPPLEWRIERLVGFSNEQVYRRRGQIATQRPAYA